MVDLKCKICNKIFSNIDSLYSHINRKHKINTPNYFKSYCHIIIDKNNKLQCQDCGMILNGIIYLTYHLRKYHNIIAEDYYLKHFTIKENENICICGNKKKFLTVLNPYRKYCSSECNMRHKTPEEKLKIREKIKETNIKRYNFPCYFSSKEAQQKSRETKQRKYNDPNYNNMKKNKETSLLKDETGLNGYERMGKSISKIKRAYTKEKIKEITDKAKKTFLKNWNCDNPMKNELVFNKVMSHSFHSKKYTLPSGKEIKIQGDEWMFLDEYFKEGNKEEDIVIHPTQDIIGKLWYKTDDEKSHRYYPDFYIPKDNLIVEVKSSYTYRSNININILKEAYCREVGYKFQFAIYN